MLNQSSISLQINRYPKSSQINRYIGTLAAVKDVVACATFLKRTATNQMFIFPASPMNVTLSGLAIVTTSETTQQKNAGPAILIR